MKAHHPPSALHAEAGPRIHAPRRSANRELPRREHESFLAHDLLRRARNGGEAAEILLLQLRDDPLALLPWSLDRLDPVRHLTWIIAAGVAISASLFVLGASPLWPFLVLVIAGSVIGRLLSTPARRTAVAAREILSELEHGTPLQEIEPELERLVRAAPDLDGARLLLAQVRLERGEVLSALIQLAPLRDRHPGEGAVVLLAALAYARSGADDDAVRMLEALRVDQFHAWSEQVARFHELCLRAQLSGVRASSDDYDTDL